jgi:hypothetical protein
MTRRHVLALLILGSSLLAPLASAAQAVTVFFGIPEVKVGEVAIDRVPKNAFLLRLWTKLLQMNAPKVEVIDSDRAADLACVISRIGDSYYWASRENKEMIRIASEGFVTFLSVDGSGYVRFTQGPVRRFGYMEHLLTGLRSVTYYGSKNLVEVDF